jgi:reactive intermediate/imine deaminase
MSKTAVHSEHAPPAIGAYSQAIRCGDLVFLSGQLPLLPETMEIVDGDFEARTHRVFANLRAVSDAAGGGLDRIVKLTIYLTDLGQFAVVNRLMAQYFSEPYPARATIGVAALPKNADIEIEAVMAA